MDTTDIAQTVGGPTFVILYLHVIVNLHNYSAFIYL